MSKRVRVLMLKEWREALKSSKTIWIGTVALPALFLGFSVYLMLTLGDLNDADIENVRHLVGALFNLPLLYFMMFPMVIPISVAVSAIIGEKEQKSLEPLLATPLTTYELFLGKALASIVPAVGVTWMAFGLFGLFMKLLLPPQVVTLALGEFGTAWLLTIFLFTPLTSLLMAAASMMIATRVSDVRAAYQLSSFVMLPILLPAIFFATQQALTNVSFIVVLSGAILLFDLVLLSFAVKLFRREEILTRWR
jgi:ABC-2 type transport system permease protein